MKGSLILNIIYLAICLPSYIARHPAQQVYRRRAVLQGQQQRARAGMLKAIIMAACLFLFGCYSTTAGIVNVGGAMAPRKYDWEKAYWERSSTKKKHSDCRVAYGPGASFSFWMHGCLTDQFDEQTCEETEGYYFWSKYCRLPYRP